MESLKSQKMVKAEIYRNIFSGKEFRNPMTNSIISLKHKLSIKYQTTTSDKMKDNIHVLFDLLDYFKTYTDDISGANMKSNKMIYDILNAINKHLEYCDDSRENLYKLCLSSILDADDLLDIFADLEKAIIYHESDDIITKNILTAIKHINAHIQSDKLAYANIKQELLMCSIKESLKNVVTGTTANMEMYGV